MIEEILDRLERIDHKEYCGGFEFADSSTFEEMGRCFDERKQLANYINNYKKNDNLNSILTELEEYLTKIAKNGADIEKLTCNNILIYLKELKEKYK